MFITAAVVGIRCLEITSRYFFFKPTMGQGAIAVAGRVLSKAKLNDKH